MFLSVFIYCCIAENILHVKSYFELKFQSLLLSCVCAQNYIRCIFFSNRVQTHERETCSTLYVKYCNGFKTEYFIANTIYKRLTFGIFVQVTNSLFHCLINLPKCIFNLSFERINILGFNFINCVVLSVSYLIADISR